MLVTQRSEKKMLHCVNKTGRLVVVPTDVRSECFRVSEEKNELGQQWVAAPTEVRIEYYTHYKVSRRRVGQLQGSVLTGLGVLVL